MITELIAGVAILAYLIWAYYYLSSQPSFTIFLKEDWYVVGDIIYSRAEDKLCRVVNGPHNGEYFLKGYLYTVKTIN